MVFTYNGGVPINLHIILIMSSNMNPTQKINIPGLKITNVFVV